MQHLQQQQQQTTAVQMAHETITICSDEELAGSRDEDGDAASLPGGAGDMGCTAASTPRFHPHNRSQDGQPEKGRQRAWHWILDGRRPFWRPHLNLVDHRAEQTFWSVAQDKKVATSIIDQWNAWQWADDDATVTDQVVYTDGSADMEN